MAAPLLHPLITRHNKSTVLNSKWESFLTQILGNNCITDCNIIQLGKKIEGGAVGQDVWNSWQKKPNASGWKPTT